MSTESLVDELVERFNGWNRDGEHGVLRYLNDAHEILMSQECEQNVIFDETTGRLPSLNTTLNVFTYTMPSTVWKVAAILINIDEEVQPIYDYGARRYLRTSYENSVVVGGVLYARVPYIRSWPYIDASRLAKVMFTRDPGTYTDYYFRHSYKRPTQILSESIEPDILPPLDRDVLIPAAAKLIEGVQNGNYDEARRIVRLELKPALWKELDSGDQGYLDNEPVDRGF